MRLCRAGKEVVNHFFTKALQGDRGGVMNLALTAALPVSGHALRGGWRSGEPLLYDHVEPSIYRGSTWWVRGPFSGAGGEVMNHFSIKALQGDRGGVMNLALTAALRGGWRSGEPLLYQGFAGR
jgi:hypothetical protein